MKTFAAEAESPKRRRRRNETARRPFQTSFVRQNGTSGWNGRDDAFRTDRARRLADVNFPAADLRTDVVLSCRGDRRDSLGRVLFAGGPFLVPLLLPFLFVPTDPLPLVPLFPPESILFWGKETVVDSPRFKRDGDGLGYGGHGVVFRPLASYSMERFSGGRDRFSHSGVRESDDAGMFRRRNARIHSSSRIDAGVDLSPDAADHFCGSRRSDQKSGPMARLFRTDSGHGRRRRPFFASRR